MSDLDNVRLADVVFEEPRKVSQFVERQFPAIYRENGRELIDLVKSYYRFLESETNQSIYNTRRMYDYRNIDTTLDRMLLFFKNKFLNGLFLEEDTRFIVKNILDLYRRKGSTEGIELFFRLFFDEEVEIFFPSINMFKPSQSRWKEGRYLQLNVVTETDVFADALNKKIFGSLSNAEAFIDSVLFINVRDSIVPIIFISNAKGRFQEFDVVFSLDPFVQYGSVYGSLNAVTIEQVETGLFSSANRIGDFVEIITTTEGIGAKGRVSEVSADLSGEIRFSIEDGGFAYTVATNPGDPNYNPFSETQVLISNQSLFLNNPNLDFIPQERVRQVNTFNVEVIGIVIGQRTDSLGILLDESAPDAGSEFFLFESNVPVETIDRDVNISRDILFVTNVNDSSSFEVGSITNAETVNIVIDVIEDFLNVQLDEEDYNDTADNPFSGSANTINLSTKLNDAFAPREFTIGEVSGFKNINPGFSYINDVFVLLKETVFSRFNLRNQIITVAPSAVNFFVGDIITQQRDIKDFEGNVQTKTIKGQVVRVEGRNVFVKQLTFESFVASRIEIINSIPTVIPIPIFKQGVSTPVTVIAISRDSTSLPAGLNARVRGDATFSSGKIKAIDIIDSGFGYNKNEEVFLLNVDKKQRILNQIENATSNTEIEDLLLLIELIEQNKDAVGTAVVSSQGVTEGRWLSFESHISQDAVIQDSFFFQDYSYEISTATPQSVFEETFKELIHPSGIKFFTKFAKTDVINSKSIIIGALIPDFGDVIDLSETIETANSGFNYLIAEE